MTLIPLFATSSFFFSLAEIDSQIQFLKNWPQLFLFLSYSKGKTENDAMSMVPKLCARVLRSTTTNLGEGVPWDISIVLRET